MFERFHRKSMIATMAALASALGVGGVAVAQSGGGASTKPAAPPAAKADPNPTPETPGQESTAPENSAADHDNVQQGDQNAPDTNGTADESAGSETPNNDGPGGHADEPGSPNADHQATGAE